MNKILRHLKLSGLIILGGLVIPALLAIIFSGFRINTVFIVSFQFYVGLIIALIGGILIAYNYSEFRKKILRTPMDREVSMDEDPEAIDWSHLMFYSGIIVVLAAIALGEIL